MNIPSLSFKGRVGVGMGHMHIVGGLVVGKTDGILSPPNPIPRPDSPLKGEERSA
jgi:hypothetical protein